MFLLQIIQTIYLIYLFFKKNLQQTINYQAVYSIRTNTQHLPTLHFCVFRLLNWNKKIQQHLGSGTSISNTFLFCSTAKVEPSGETNVNQRRRTDAADVPWSSLGSLTLAA